VATHPAPTKKKKKRQVGLIRSGVVYELFLTNLPQSAFTASDVVSLYLHRGAFETALEDEDIEQEPDRWCSHSVMSDKKLGRSWLSGPGTCDWSWGTSLLLNQCGPPCLPISIKLSIQSLQEREVATLFSGRNRQSKVEKN
jgi:hypothetical protein